MKAMLISVGLGLALSLAGPATADDSVTAELMKKCTYPDAPTIPNGRKASEEEMLEAQSALKAFLAAGEEYTSCLQGVEASWGEEATDEQRAVMVIFYNKAVDEMHAVGDMFNAAVRAYKGRHSN